MITVSYKSAQKQMVTLRVQVMHLGSRKVGHSKCAGWPSSHQFTRLGTSGCMTRGTDSAGNANIQRLARASWRAGIGGATPRGVGSGRIGRAVLAVSRA